MSRLLTTLALTLCCGAALARADHVKAELLADHASVRPGGTIGVAVVLTVEPHWHVYWINPGDTGSPPKVRWTLPANSTAGPLEFPVPKRIDVGNDLNAFGYEDRVALLTRVTVPADAHGTFDLAAGVSAVVCHDECVLERHPVTLRLPVGDDKLANADQFSTWRTAMPLMTDAAFEAVFSPDGREGRLEYELPPGVVGVDFFPPRIDGLSFARPETGQTNGRPVYRLPFKVLPGPALDVHAAGIVLTRSPGGETASASVIYHMVTAGRPPVAPNP